MAAPVTKNRPAQPAESKAAKKKKGGKTDRSDSPAPSTTSPDKPVSVAGHDTSPDDEAPYIRELQKSIRNLSKKLGNYEKLDALVAEHSGKSLDELVSKRVINADQKASLDNKPKLQAQKAQLEDQLAQYKKVDQDYRERLNTVKDELEQAMTSKHEAEVAKAAADAKDAAEAAGQKTLDDSLLVLSQFLRLAAARRSDEHSADLDENRALEGVLLQVYSGDANGVATMVKLVQGSTERTKSVTGDELETTYAKVKEVSIAHAVPLYSTSEEAAGAGDEAAAEPATDPTVAHASLTEIEAGDDVALTNGHAAEEHATAPPPNGDVADSAANAAAEAHWDATNGSLSASQEWVEVPSNPAETDAGPNVAATAAPNSQSWADDAAENAADLLPQADPNDGFQSVQRNRGRGDRDGGRGRGNNFRGRGFRGDGRGRGRGGRGGNGSFRGQNQRRTEES